LLTGFAERIIAAQGGDARTEQALIQENMPLVTALSRRFLGRGAAFEDLVQLGSLGLLKAVRRFDVTLNLCFSTYAVPLILGEIRRFLRDDGLVKISRSTKQLAAQAALFAELDLPIDALAEKLGCSPEDAAFALSARQSVLSLDEPMGEDGGTLAETLGGEETETGAVNRMLVADLLASLPERERKILRMRYFEYRTQQEIADQLGVSQVQVSRIEKKTLLLLRERAG